MKKVKFGYKSVSIGDHKDLRYKGVVYRGRSKKEDVQKLIKKAKFIDE